MHKGESIRSVVTFCYSFVGLLTNMSVSEPRVSENCAYGTIGFYSHYLKLVTVKCDSPSTSHPRQHQSRFQFSLA